MTTSEKLEVMEELWGDLARSDYAPPDWHGRILEERRALAESGRTGFTDWETAKKEIDERVS